MIEVRTSAIAHARDSRTKRARIGREKCFLSIGTLNQPTVTDTVCYSITNEEVRIRISNAIGPYEDLLTTVKKRKLKWYGHVSRSSGLSKTILQGTVPGGRRRGRQRRRWEDNISDWTGLKLSETLRMTENREEWREMVVRASVAPQRSTRLRDR